ncbi:calcium-translocating P-type ATPase, PMCA-type, partial [Myxococcota bacterium]|nr:calcium-translocating P-type ATPase, PMCA-type [Myxococcota bacterium]
TSTITGESASTTAEINTPVYRGFTVLSGEGAMIVTAVGQATEMGKIRDALATAPEPTPLQERLSELADRIGLGGTIAAAAIFLALFMRSVVLGGIDLISPECLQSVLNAFIVSVTIVVVAVPEGLPLAVTLSLALNMRRMAKDNILVRTLAASETLGSVTIIASDKTGTLTLNRMRVSSLWTVEGGEEPAVGKCLRGPDDQLFQYLMAANSTAHLEEKGGGRFDYIGNPTEGSLLFHLHDCGHDYITIRDSVTVLGRRSFSSARKMMSTQVAWDDQRSVLLVKGAPERILERCVDCASALGVSPSSLGVSPSSLGATRIPLAQTRGELDRILNQAASRGERVLALAYRFLPLDTRDYEEDQLTLWGLAIIKDPVRHEVADSIVQCRAAGIRVLMVTGDNPLTARAIAEELGLMDGGGEVWDGMQFEGMSDDEIKSRLPDLRILARSRPNDKFRLVSLLKEINEVVAVTGDGTNDAPALKKADVGVAMGICGTEVSKEASDVVLLDDNFTSIVKGVLWGRSLHANIQKFLQFQLTVNVAALSVAFVGALLGGRSPLTAVQLLWVNLIMDTLAAIGLGLEPPEDTLLKKKPRARKAPLITSSMWFMILGMGAYTFITLMILFRWNFLGEGSRHSAEHLSVIFTTFVFLQVFNELNARSLSGHESAFHSLHRSRGFLLILGLICVVQVMLTQFGGRLFQTTPLSLATWARVLAFSSTALLMGVLLRFLMRRLGVGAARIEEDTH